MQFKKLVSEELEVNSGEYRLVFGHKIMNDNRTLKEHNVKDKSTIWFMFISEQQPMARFGCSVDRPPFLIEEENASNEICVTVTSQRTSRVINADKNSKVEDVSKISAIFYRPYSLVFHTFVSISFTVQKISCNRV